jgi:membrane-associated phospholipid phosphatase
VATPRSWAVALAFGAGLAVASLVAAGAAAAQADSAGGQPAAAQPAPADAGHRLAWTPLYLLDYGLVAAGLYVNGFAGLSPTHRARIGPSFDPADPAAILGPEHSGLLGRPFRAEADWTLPDSWMQAAAVTHLLVIPAHELAAARAAGRPVSAPRLHAATLAATEALAVTGGATRLVKVWTGRLRPDFQDRVRHVYCSLPEPGGIDCAGVDPDRLFHDPDRARKELDDGRASFPSGHAATGMVMATSLALDVGAHWVWGRDATPASRRAGVLAMAVIGGLGTVPGLTRSALGDHVHHTGDVVAGALIGLAIGNAFHWLHFDTHGVPRPRHWLARRRTGAALDHAVDQVRVAAAGDDLVLLVTWRSR